MQTQRESHSQTQDYFSTDIQTLRIHQSANDEIVHHPIKHPPVKSGAIPISRFQPKCSRTVWNTTIMCRCFFSSSSSLFVLLGFFISKCLRNYAKEWTSARQRSSPRRQNAHSHIMMHCFPRSALKCLKTSNSLLRWQDLILLTKKKGVKE